jgi:hypothetical protein
VSTAIKAMWPQARCERLRQSSIYALCSVKILFVAKGRCRLHGGASDSGDPPGKRNGQYHHGERTRAAIAERRKFGALLKILRAGLTQIHKLECGRRREPLSWSGWRHFEGPAIASIQNNSGLPEGLAGGPAAG